MGVFSLNRFLQFRNIKSGHLHKSIGRFRSSFRIGHEFTQNAWHYLPGNAIFVLKPATLSGLSLFCEVIPIIIYLILRIDGKNKRDFFIKIEFGTQLFKHMKRFPIISNTTAIGFSETNLKSVNIS